MEGEIVEKSKEFGVAHTLGRGIEYLLLQTSITRELHEWLATRYYRWKYSKELREYTIPIHPFSLRYVSPDDIVSYSYRAKTEPNAIYDIGSIHGGDWDLKRRQRSLFKGPSIEETSLYESMRDRFVHGDPWEETEVYRKVVDIVSDGGQAWHGCRSVADVEERCRELDQLYHSIMEEGYKTQVELRDGPPDISDSFGYLNRHLLEVCVDISRNGEFLLIDSRHRATLARILDIETIPVQVIARHQKWIDAIESAYLSNELLDHPDFKDCR